MKRKTSSSTGMVILVGSTMVFIVFFASLCFGSVAVSFQDAWLAISGADAASPMGKHIIMDLRLPRTLMACLAGSGLALGGLGFQCVLRNSLAEPYILGVSGGAAVGYVLTMVLGLGLASNTAGAFLGAALVVVLILQASFGKDTWQGLLLCGVMLNAFCGAIVMFLMSIANYHDVSRIIFWFMGNLESSTMTTVFYVALAVVPGSIFLIFSGHRMNLFLLGADTAKTLGMEPVFFARLQLGVISVIVAVLVAMVGPIGFVGLVVPQSLRLLIQADHRVLAPAVAFGGAAFLMLCDLLARVLPSSGELPVGVLTALVGAPVFIFLQRKGV